MDGGLNGAVLKFVKRLPEEVILDYEKLSAVLWKRFPYRQVYTSPVPLRILRIKQGSQTLEQYCEEFFDLNSQSSDKETEWLCKSWVKGLNSSSMKNMFDNHHFNENEKGNSLTAEKTIYAARYMYWVLGAGDKTVQ